MHCNFWFGLYRIQALRKELNKVIATRLQVSVVNPGANYEELSGISSEYKRKLGVMDNLVKKQLYVTELLGILPRALPKEVWLTSFSFKREEDKAEVSLEGMVYLADADSDKEFGALNQFVMNLKGNPEFNKYFKEVNITSLDRRQLGNLMTVNFLISCKIY